MTQDPWMSPEQQWRSPGEESPSAAAAPPPAGAVPGGGSPETMSAYFAPPPPPPNLPPVPPAVPGYPPPQPYQMYQVPMGFVPAGPVPQMPRPGTVKAAVGLMFGGIGASLLAMLITMATMQTIDDRLQEHIFFNGGDYASDHSGIILLIVLIGVVGNGLWIWMAIACSGGYHWARVTGTVFFGLGCLLWLFTLANEAITPAVKVFVGLAAVAGLVAMILLWVGGSGPYFQSRRIAAGYVAYPGQPGYPAAYPGVPAGVQYPQYPAYPQSPYPGQAGFPGQAGYGYQQPEQGLGQAQVPQPPHPGLPGQPGQPGQPPANWPGQGS